MQWNLIFKNHHTVRVPHQPNAAPRREGGRGKRLVLKWLVRRSEEEFLQSQRRRAGFLSTPSRKESFTDSVKSWSSNHSRWVLGCGFRRSTLLLCNNYVITDNQVCNYGLLHVACFPNSGCCCRHTQTRTRAHMPVMSCQQLLRMLLCGMNMTVPLCRSLSPGPITRLASASRLQNAPLDGRERGACVWGRAEARSELTALTSVSSAAIVWTPTLTHSSQETPELKILRCRSDAAAFDLFSLNTDTVNNGKVIMTWFLHNMTLYKTLSLIS